MTLFRSELLPIHPPRYRSRIGEGLARYGRLRDARDQCGAPHAHSQRLRACAAHDAHAPASASASICDTVNVPAAQASPQIACAA